MDGQEWALPILFDGVDVSYFRPFFQLSSLSSAHVTEFCSSREGVCLAPCPTDHISDAWIFQAGGQYHFQGISISRPASSRVFSFLQALSCLSCFLCQGYCSSPEYPILESIFGERRVGFFCTRK